MRHVQRADCVGLLVGRAGREPLAAIRIHPVGKALHDLNGSVCFYQSIFFSPSAPSTASGSDSWGVSETLYSVPDHYAVEIDKNQQINRLWHLRS